MTNMKDSCSENQGFPAKDILFFISVRGGFAHV